MGRRGHQSVPFALAALVDFEELLPNQLASDPQIVHPTSGGIAFVLLCSSMVYDVQYTSINSSITKFTPITSNDSVTNLFEGISDQGFYGNLYLQQAANVAGLAESAQGIANQMALSFSAVFRFWRLRLFTDSSCYCGTATNDLYCRCCSTGAAVYCCCFRSSFRASRTCFGSFGHI